MAELTRAIGDDAARLLALRFGGTVVYVPRIFGEDHPLRLALGPDAAEKLANAYADERIYIPKQADRRRRVLELHTAGALTVAAIAIETGFSERHVYRLLSAADDGQLNPLRMSAPALPDTGHGAADYMTS